VSLLDVHSDRLRLDPGVATKLMRGAAVVGVAGIALSLLLAVVDSGWERFFRSYLTAFMFVLSLGLGGLFFTFIQHATRAGWSVALRRVSEIGAASLKWIWILFLPIAGLVIAGHGKMLYSWMSPEYRAADALYQHKEPFLNVPFWLVRAVIYFAVWAAFGAFYFRNSCRQDETGDVNLTHRMQWWAPLCAILFGVTLTFGSIDWIKALEAHWFSTIFGVYFFAASCCGFFSLQIITVYLLQRSGRLTDEITREHYQDMGKLLFAFGIVFWAYIAYSQYMLQWYANIPEETTWYLARIMGGWQWVSLLLLVGHFALPFVILVTKHTKRAKGILAIIAVWTLLLHFVDVYWLVMPKVPAEAIHDAGSLNELREAAATGAIDVGWGPQLIDLTLLVGLMGLFVTGFVRQMRSCLLIPVRDPRLHESLAFENM
jgi:hypothetical protein